MNTKGIRYELNLTAQEFADKFGIPVGTVRNWDSRDCMPDYVFNLIVNICKLEDQNKNLEKAINKLILK